MDPLSEVLQDFRLSGVNYGVASFGIRGCIFFPQQQLLRFHFVSQGPCWIHTEAQGWQELRDGDLVLLPQGIAHKLSSAPDVIGDSLEDCRMIDLGRNVCEVVQQGVMTPAQAARCFAVPWLLGAYALDPLIPLMPPIIKGCDVAGNDPIIGPLLSAMTQEAAQPQMGRALAAIHRNPVQHWTIETLAGVAGQSRTVFADRFSTVVGEGPARYLARLRMQLARELLTQGGTSVAEVAARLGWIRSLLCPGLQAHSQHLSGVVRRTSFGRTGINFGF